MPGPRSRRERRVRLDRSVEIAAPCGRVFDLWTRWETLPRVLESVRRTKRIDGVHVLWDVEIAGRQVVWEAEVVETIPEKLVRWRSVWGAWNRGEVGFRALDEDHTRVDVTIEYRPRSWLERIGARLGVPDVYVARDLERFRRHVERLSRDEDEESGERDAETARGPR